MPEQLQFPFLVSLDFPGRTTLKLPEIAERLGVCDRHLAGEIETGELVALDLKRKNVSRPCWRVPIENYRDYVLRKLTGPMRMNLLKNLPIAVRRQLIRELQDSLNLK